ncbi:hypothetical protein [uncultured Psychroserpens sp.]|uniref:hypothetical protein n=1 Tax=uncultured Psychroserpens sp. TaxID=255436 RepID=UPI002627D565|nr:hypothetical protein [uncultured Psychroserpens sp.]
MNPLIQQHLDKICETYNCGEDSYDEKTNEGILKYYSEQRFVEKWKDNVALVLIDDNKLDYFVIPKNYGMIDEVLDLKIEDGIFYNSDIILYPFDEKIYFLKVEVLKKMLNHTDYDEIKEFIAKLKLVFEDRNINTIPKAIPNKNRVSWQSVIRYASKEYQPIALKRTLENPKEP